jgi:hypothetical protein
MTMKQGFAVGLFFGAVAFYFLYGNIIFTLAPALARGFVLFIAILVFPILSFVVGIWSTLAGHAILGTTTNGFLYGFTTAFDAPYVLYLFLQFSQGNLPSPWWT